MITAILDTNVFVQAAIGSPRAAASRVIEALDAGEFRLVVSPGIVDELLGAMLLPHIRTRHGWTDDEILRFVLSFVPSADVYMAQCRIPASLTRDATDTKFLALAEESKADFIVTNDRRHLLRVRRFAQTRIVTPAQFLRELS